MIAISPRRIEGDWKCGYSLDYHTLSSEYIGDDEYGHPQFDTKRSEMGELLYRLKYRSDKAVLKLITETVAEFVINKKWAIDVLVPVPPSRTARSFQPVMAVAKGVAKSLGVPLCSDCLVKIKETPELKNVYEFKERMALLKDAYAVAARDLAGRAILLLDDLYRSGATLNAVAGVLKRKGKGSAVYVITLTMTRRKT